MPAVFAMADERQLTELEGAILTEIALRGNDTAYKVRRAFENSPSVQWQGSAGAVSPAIHRLVNRGLLIAAPHPTRRGRTLTLSAAGEEALDSWAADVEAACGVGLDPFRLRAGVWERLSPRRRNALFARLLAQLERELAIRRESPASFSELPQPKELAWALFESRVRWLKRRLSRK
jgi:DNA-binding PadR family transcriptional regulator